jgi:flagellar hook protein FlgE
MDVIGNNIANVNTVGFKRNRVSFQDMLYQTSKGASAPDAGNVFGGTNPMQVGLGVNISTIDTIITQGSTQTTGKPSDLMIQGDGLFELNVNPAAVGSAVYTRAGNFGFDSQGYLVNSANGLYVQSTAGARMQVPTTAESWKVDSSGVLSYVPAGGGAAIVVGTIRLAKFPNAAGLEKIGDNSYKATLNSGTVINTFAKDAANGMGQTTIVPGALEMSNVDLSQEFTDMIITQRGFQANSRIITVSDEMLQELVNLKR